ncbi:MAG: DUF3785 family protein [Clostridium sp.]
MLEFKFLHVENEFVLGEDNLAYIDNEEVENFDLKEIVDLLNETSEEVDFDYEYFADKCDECGGGKTLDKKHYGFLEYHFYIFTKAGDYVMSNISKDFENTSYTKLVKERKIDNSYIVSILLCEDCKTYNIAIEQCDM